MIADELLVRRSNVAVVLLGCFLLSSIAGLAHGEEPPVTLTTDMTTYGPGDTVYVTVAVSSIYSLRCVVASKLYALCVSVVMIPMEPPTCSYSCPTASAILLLRPPAYNTVGYVKGYQGKVALQLPSDTPAGRYDIEMLTCPNWIINGNTITCEAGKFVLYQLAKVEIKVEGKTPRQT